MSYTGEIRVTRPSSLHQLGAAAAIIDALAVGTAVAGILAVVGASYAVGKIVGAPAKLISTALNSARTRGVSKDLAAAAESMEKLGGELSRSIDKVSADCYERYAEAAKRLEEIYGKEPDLSAFRKELDEAGKRFRREISEKSRALESRYIGELNAIVSKSRSEMEIERREVLGSVQRISDDLARKEKSVQITKEVLDGTEALLNELKAACSGSGLCGKAVSECLALCETARQRLDSGLYEAALADAFAAKNAALVKISEIVQREMSGRQRYIDAKAMLDGCFELVNGTSEVEFTFDKTCDGKPLDVKVDDLRVYYRGSFERLESELSAVKERFDAADMRDLVPEELEDMLTGLTAWQNDFFSETQKAYERLDNVMMRIETARLLREKYEDEGYEELSEEEESDASPLDRMVVRMRHGVTGELLCIRLLAEERADGHIDMSIEIEDRRKYDGSPQEVEKARERARESVCSALRDSGIGKNMQLRQRCADPGVRGDE